MCIWQSQAFAGALNFGTSVPTELGTAICAWTARDSATRPALTAASPALFRNVRRAIPSSLMTRTPAHTPRLPSDSPAANFGDELVIRFIPAKLSTAQLLIG